MEIIDDQIGRAIATGNNKWRKLRTGTIPFSIEYSRVNAERCFWPLLLRRRYGRNISTTTIRRLAKKLDIHRPYDIDLSEMKFQLHQAGLDYADIVHHAKSKRDGDKENLASANATDANLDKVKVLKRIMHDEA